MEAATVRGAVEEARGVVAVNEGAQQANVAEEGALYAEAGRKEGHGAVVVEHGGEARRGNI